MNVYDYIYYKIYYLAERSSLPWWSDLKAGFLIAAIEGLLIAFINYKICKLFGVGDATELGKWGYILIIGGPPLIINYFLFGFRDRWKEILSHFDKADQQEIRKMNIQMTLISFIVIFIIFGLMLL